MASCRGRASARRRPCGTPLTLFLAATMTIAVAQAQAAVGNQVVTPEQLQAEACQQGARAVLQQYAADRSADKIQLPILNQATQMCIQD